MSVVMAAGRIEWNMFRPVKTKVVLSTLRQHSRKYSIVQVQLQNIFAAKALSLP